MIVAEYPLQKPDDDSKVKCCRTNQCEKKEGAHRYRYSKGLHQWSTTQQRPQMTGAFVTSCRQFFSDNFRTGMNV